MEKLALITGGTNGIGKETALELAKKDYCIHILGRNKKNGEEVLSKIFKISPAKNHQLFIVDLSQINEVIDFAEEYIKNTEQLDVLILNAGIFSKKSIPTREGIEKSFMIGYLSRYILSVKFNDILEQSNDPKVIHLNGSIIGKINYHNIINNRIKGIKAIWQSSIANAILVYHCTKQKSTKLRHMHWNPGIVNTNPSKSLPKIFQLLLKITGMIEANEAGKILAEKIDSDLGETLNSQFFVKGKIKNQKNKYIKSKTVFLELMEFSEKNTGVRF
ncbi:MAG: SDR family NAD(P)-dependent oxidoreductase [Marinifilaceae bacterium]|jgi:NADP-dependent 3-hydroxy acid dehydrogenase YdfG|nr:SDR family NAD(P)-dependent oxidoreductase [Marinifilaceae bacterium]